MGQLPLIAPRPPRLSEMGAGLRAIEERGIYSNGGPVVRGFEADATAKLFGGAGDCLAVGNATLGLMLAIRQAAGPRAGTGAYALIPSFTFAATAHAAEWAGLTPLLCDIDPEDWASSAAAEAEAFALHGEAIAVVVPYAAFGMGIDLARYRAYHARGVGVVIDAAASLGALDAEGGQFGAGAPFAIVYSMHATKVFATAEGGLIHSGDAGLIDALRRMTNFGFAGGRSAEGPGINAKLPEILGLSAAAKLGEIEGVAAHRMTLDAAYREMLGGFAADKGFEFQNLRGSRPALQFQSLLLPRAFAGHRRAIIAMLAEQGIGAAHYFSPHLAEQPWFRAHSVFGALPVSDEVSGRILSLPVTDGMTVADVERVCGALIDACARSGLNGIQRERRGRGVHAALIVGGGPAGTALLTAASKSESLVELARGGLAVIERDAVLGRGLIGTYAITSDSTAETFLTAVKDNSHAGLAALTRHHGAQEVAMHIGRLGVPLARATPLLEATGAELGAIVAGNGGTVATRSEVVEARRTADGLWAARVRNLLTGEERVMRTAALVIATGGYQAREHIAAEQIAGLTLGELAGDRLMLGDEFLKIGGLDVLRARIADKRAPRIAIVGGSTSAMAAAALMLKAAPALPLGAGGLALYHRRPLRPFYHSVEAARDDGFSDFGPEDICPVTGFVYRLAGFRLEARELVLRMLGVGRRAPDPRMMLRQISELDDATVREELAAADVVIGALGYRPRAMRLFDVDGVPIALAADEPGRPRLVDQQCRVIDADGVPVPGVYGIGLASGHVPDGKLGGESSFSGKANGLWLWQNDIGQMIVDQLLGERARAVA
ncbi:DegT/DnrJ/EryC1/StrS family aminotransferase [Sphingomonas sp. M1-B02]|uniref:DegT/DnrJ/EryC1/StrS family aminotransferase n=1 Tax=Sphingomonas sp. M1-B02 TaxID=3114300 RepID=UPI0022406DEB|nr:DegT/DnrJ/EryC1/StrS family aminotransferase [Sphingomonas sp. S6-11]UZK67453.1 DegT/DnrJ/EryC1/StrS family aminotransferase [Sphingomonas sp. S6-11]